MEINTLISEIQNLLCVSQNQNREIESLIYSRVSRSQNVSNIPGLSMDITQSQKTYTESYLKDMQIKIQELHQDIQKLCHFINECSEGKDNNFEIQQLLRKYC